MNIIIYPRKSRQQDLFDDGKFNEIACADLVACHEDDNIYHILKSRATKSGQTVDEEGLMTIIKANIDNRFGRALGAVAWQG